MTLPLPNLFECPECQSPSSMIETLKAGWFCGGCSHVFELNAEGRIVRHETNHSPRRMDVSGVEIDGP